MIRTGAGSPFESADVAELGFAFAGHMDTALIVFYEGVAAVTASPSLVGG